MQGIAKSTDKSIKQSHMLREHINEFNHNGKL